MRHSGIFVLTMYVICYEYELYINYYTNYPLLEYMIKLNVIVSLYNRKSYHTSKQHRSYEKEFSSLQPYMLRTFHSISNLETELENTIIY